MAKLKARGGGTVDELIADLPEPAEAIELRPQILAEDFASYADRVLQAFEAFVEAEPGLTLTPNNHEGVHVTADGGWILLRKSLHDPNLPINIESDRLGGVAPLKEMVVAFLAAFDGLKLP
jgi:phosphomannomutase